MYEYAPIAKVLHTLDDAAASRTKCKFDIGYLIAKENMAFAKMGSLCQLEERHGKFDIGYLIAKENMEFAKMGPLCQLEERHGINLVSCPRRVHRVVPAEFNNCNVNM